MSHLSIGEVLALLLEEFSDITISKIRFLESQGLIDPERTPSGYRKFYDDDVELLRCILREQRENYLPLRVIKDRLDSGEIDPTSEVPRPRGIRNVFTDDTPNAADIIASPRQPTGAEALFARTDHVATSADDAPPAATSTEATIPPTTSTHDPPRSGTPFRPRVRPRRRRSPARHCSLVLCSRVTNCARWLRSRPSRSKASSRTGSSAASEAQAGCTGQMPSKIASISQHFLAAGFDARHLRGWKVAADREAGLFEQMIQPLLRQRNPAARAQAREQLSEMEQFGSQLRSALMRSTMRHHFED